MRKFLFIFIALLAIGVTCYSQNMYWHAFGSSGCLDDEKGATLGQSVIADFSTSDSPALEGSSGDITSVSAGDGLTGGGASGDVTMSVNVGAGLEIESDIVQIANEEITWEMLSPDVRDSIESTIISDAIPYNGMILSDAENNPVLNDAGYQYAGAYLTATVTESGNYWFTHSPMPYTWSGMKACAMGDSIFLIGGNWDNWTNNVLYWVDHGWYPKMDLPWGRRSGSAVAYGRDVYYFGGEYEDPPILTYMYDSEYNIWSYKAAMPTQQNSTAAVVFRDSIFVLGGHIDGNAVQVYDPVSNTWNALHNDMVDNHTLAYAVVFDSSIYVFGTTPSVEKYDFTTDTWIIYDSVPEFTSIIGVSTTEDAIIVITPESDVWTFDPIHRIWDTRANLPYSRHSVGCTNSNNRIFLFGGGGESGSEASTIWEYFPGPDSIYYIYRKTD